MILFFKTKTSFVCTPNLKGTIKLRDIFRTALLTLLGLQSRSVRILLGTRVVCPYIGTAVLKELPRGRGRTFWAEGF